ncbi:hypothetical protein EJB05_32248 [Eragrostis curvula]|uniref:RING-type domain-containing protein n=1 Tax=Eragrostis curvula TaxID=38414 RepID=A0A5J9UH16_9POAL|nr:hypothetical protein EJB05_32248 [Eragrostis curvula]
MGANCCIAAKERSLPSLAPVEVSAYRIRHSPSWSFRWDNRTHIEDIMENNAVFSNHSSGNTQPELKSGSVAPTECHTGGDGRADVFRRVKGQKSDKKMEASKLSKIDSQVDQSSAKNSHLESNSYKTPDVVAAASEMKTPESLPSTPSQGPKPEPADPSSSMNHSNSTVKSCPSPGNQPHRQIRDGNVPPLKNFIENSPAERPSSSTLSSGSHDLFAALSHGESSNGLSTRTPSESVVTSQRGWLFGNEPVDSIASKLSGSNASHPTFSPDQGVCKLCSRLLKERSFWNGHELAVVAVLFCGHAYHGNCLDSITEESEKYDPPCPVCTHGESCTAKLFGKLELKIKNNALKSISRLVLGHQDQIWGVNQQERRASGQGVGENSKLDVIYSESACWCELMTDQYCGPVESKVVQGLACGATSTILHDSILFIEALIVLAQM